MQVSLLFPTRFISAGDLIAAGGKDVTLRIARAYADNLQVKGGGTTRKLVLQFEKAQKQLVLCKTSAYVIAGLYGHETDAWAGKRITLYHTMVDAFGKMVPAIRVRPVVPPEPRPILASPAPEHMPVEAEFAAGEPNRDGTFNGPGDMHPIDQAVLAGAAAGLGLEPVFPGNGSAAE